MTNSIDQKRTVIEEESSMNDSGNYAKFAADSSINNEALPKLIINMEDYYADYQGMK